MKSTKWIKEKIMSVEERIESYKYYYLPIQ